MKTILVVISRSKDAIFDTIGHCSEQSLKYIKDEYIYVIKFPNKDKAREYMCFDLIRDDLLGYNEKRQKYNDRINEFRFNGLNISVRTGDEMRSFMRFFEKDSCFV